MEIKNNKLIKVTNKDIINGTIIIPDNITEINEYAFAGTDLKFINIPEHVNKIGNNAFYGCKLLETINISSNITRIGEEAFANCSSLETINISGSITVIKAHAFEGCISLQSINIPSNITKIDEEAFANCSSLKTINISSRVTQIKFGAFENCTNLQSINLPNNITKIERCTFGGCQNLKKINIPNSVTEIKEHAFYSCFNLQSLIVECNIQEIEDNAFGKCPNLDTIIVSEDTIYTDLNKICEQIQKDNSAKYFNININSSLFNIANSISHSNLSIDSLGNYVINNLIIYNTPINLKKLIKSYKCDIEYTGMTKKQIISNTYIDEIRKNELLYKIKDKLEHNNITNKKYFIYSQHQDIINTIIYNLNNSISYDYRTDLEHYIKKYIETKNVETKNTENKKTSIIPSNTIENNLNNKNILEVTNDLKNYQIKELNTNEYMELFNFGNELNIYPLYISTTLHNTVTHFSKDIKIHQIKQKFDELTTISNKESFFKKLFFKYDNDNITLNKEILEELNNSINNELTSSEKEIQILNELKELIIIYIKKLEEHINYLENYNLDFVNLDVISESDLLLKKNIKIEKIESFKNSIILIQEKYIQINLIINSNLIYMDKLNNLRVNLLPNLISKIMTNNVIKKDIENIQEFIEISNTLNEIIDNQNNIESNIKNDNFTLDNNEKNKQFYKKL